ncbi:MULTISPECIES: ABC transporter substrate-binding protein [unclassified Roseovarius]|uniref:ABC transporter substrate-binding protein n=1 Tax=unclassified Roseovarius TaxID=2614913 RepID=UPI00273F82CD|nr:MULTISPECIES: ABC transporter substrate-binding protein [unclassified Roseovarius]
MTKSFIQPTRRSVLGGGAALGALGLAGMPALAETPKRGGTVRVALAEGSTQDSLNPWTYTDIYMMSVGFATHSTLTEIDPSGALVGDAAESWEGSNAAQTWTFKLRPEVTFSDGRPLRPEDVIGSLKFHGGEDSGSGMRTTADMITDIRKDGDHTVVFELQGPNADFPFLMADYHFILMPVEDGKPNWEDFIGTGGYTLEDHQAGVRTLLKRRDDYWKENRAWFDEIEILYVPDVSSRQSGLQTGEIDIMSRVDLKTVGLLERVPSVKVEEATGFLHYTFPMNTGLNPYDNNELRLALKHGIDRETMVKTILNGRGIVGNDHPIAPSVPYHNTELAQRTYDPDKAKFHLKNAGLESIDLTCAAADAAYSGALDATVLYREHLAPAGINLTVDRKPNDGYWSDVWMQEPFCACYWGGRPTCDWMFSSAYASGADWNDTFWEHERFNELLVQARGELNSDLRSEMYGEMQQIVSDEGGVVVWAFANYVYAMSEKVAHGPDVASNWEMDGGRWTERWWFA